MNENILDEINLSYNEIIGYDDETIYIPIYKSKHKNNIIDTLVLGGGGMKGVALVGALKALEIKGILDNIKTYSGASIGALISTLLNIGYTPNEINYIWLTLEIDKLQSLDITNLMKYFGLDKGEKIEYMVKRLITAKGFDENITLQQLYEQTDKEIYMSTVCLNKMKPCYISHNSDPNLPLFNAIRMSISIPIFYTPFEYKDHLYIDGGCMDNYPIHLFKDKIDKVIGIYLSGHVNVLNKIEDLETFLIYAIKCFMEGYNMQTFKGYENNTVLVYLDNINMINYNINSEHKKYMFNKGFYETIKFISNCNN